VLRVKCEEGEDAETTLEKKYEGGLIQLSRDVSEFYTVDDNDRHRDVYITGEDTSEAPEGKHLQKIHEDLFVERPDPEVTSVRIHGGGLVHAQNYIKYLQTMHRDDPVRAFWMLAEAYPVLPSVVISDLLTNSKNVEIEPLCGGESLNVRHKPSNENRLNRYVRDTNS